MWVDGQGACHTVALPDSTFLMSTVFRQSLDQLILGDQEDLAALIEMEQMRFFEEMSAALLWESEETDFVAAAPPLMLLKESVETLEDLRKLIRGIDTRWRLDALLALEDYVS